MTVATSPSVADLLATPWPFHDWLRIQGPSSIVGTCGMVGRCPVAMFLILSGINSPEVGKHEIDFLVGGRYQRFAAPEWLARFVRAVDSMFPRSTYGQHPRITAAEALSVLDAVCADLALVRGAA